MTVKPHDLIDFMRNATEEMARDYERIQKRATEDPGTAGDQGEENWADLLRGWLPATYHVVTKGRILTHKGIAGPQIDVLVLNPAYPRKLLNNKHYLASGVVAAFECKITARKEHIFAAMQNAAHIKSNLPKRNETRYRQLHSPIIYGLLAHSHCWRGKKSTPLENITQHLDAADRQIIKHPREMLDLMCVADLSCWVGVRKPWDTDMISIDDQEQGILPELAITSLFTGYTRNSSGGCQGH